MTFASSHRLALLVAFAIVALSQSAYAQRFGSRSNSLMSLAANEAVQKDIGIGGEAAARLNAINDEYRNASQKEFSATGIDYTAISDLPALERAAEMRKVTEKTAQVNRKLTAEFLPKIEQVLQPEQIQRLKQIQLQASGLDVWLNQEWSNSLDLSPEQQSQLTELRSDYNRRTELLDGEFQQRFARMRELNSERDQKATLLLTSDQQDKLAELKGPLFDISQLGFRRRGNN